MRSEEDFEPPQLMHVGKFTFARVSSSSFTSRETFPLKFSEIITTPRTLLRRFSSIYALEHFHNLIRAVFQFPRSKSYFSAVVVCAREVIWRVMSIPCVMYAERNFPLRRWKNENPFEEKKIAAGVGSLSGKVYSFKNLDALTKLLHRRCWY